MFTLLFAVASAQITPIQLMQGTTVLQGCLDDPNCGEVFTTSMSETLYDYGFVLQYSPTPTSAISGKGNGFVTEVRVDSLPVSGGSEQINAFLPPAVPRLGIGIQSGSKHFNRAAPQMSVYASAVPPLRTETVDLFNVTAGASLAYPLTNRSGLWLGAEADHNYTAIDAAVVNEITDISALNESGCAYPNCVDRFRQQMTSIRFGLSMDPGRFLSLFGKAGVGWSKARFALGIDNSLWGLSAALPQVIGGGSIRLKDKLQLSFAWEGSLRGGTITDFDAADFVSKWTGSIGFRTGRKRTLAETVK